MFHSFSLEYCLSKRIISAMEAHSSYSYTSSSSTTRQQKAAHSSLHSVRRPPMKPSKKPIAPLPPTAPPTPRVYTVDPVNFRDLVQKLTGAPEFSSQPQRLRSVAPPPVTVAASSPLFGSEDNAVSPLQFLPSPLEAKSQKWSPSSNDWFSFSILSPGTLSSLEQSTVP